MRWNFFGSAFQRRSWHKITAVILAGLVCAGIAYSVMTGGDFIRDKEAAASVSGAGEKITTLVIEERDIMTASSSPLLFFSTCSNLA